VVEAPAPAQAPREEAAAVVAPGRSKRAILALRNPQKQRSDAAVNGD